MVGHSGHFRRGFVYTLVLDVMARLASTVGVVILIRKLSTTDYAFVVVFLAAGQFLGASATGGVRMLYLRNAAEAVSRREEAASGFGSCIATQTVLLAVFASVALALATVAGVGRGEDRLALAVAGTTFAFGTAATELAVAREQAHLRFMRAGLIAVARSVLLLAVAATTYLGLHSGRAIALASGCALAGLGLATAAAIMAAEASPMRLRFREWVWGHESGWLTVYYVSSAGYATVDVFLIAALLSRTDVASYGAAQRYQAVVLGALPALIAVFRVRTSQVDLIDSAEAQRQMLVAWMRRLAIPAVVGIGVIAVAAPWAIPLVNGHRYPASVRLFELLMVSAIVTYLVTPAPSLLMAQRRFRLLAILMSATVCANGICDSIMAQTLGVTGLVVFAVAIDLSVSFIAARFALHLPIVPVTCRRLLRLPPASLP